MATTMRQMEHLQPLNRIESKTGPSAGCAPLLDLADIPGIVTARNNIDTVETPAEITTKARQVTAAAPLNPPYFSRTNLQ
jgi:hypothetical protein